MAIGLGIAFFVAAAAARVMSAPPALSIYLSIAAVLILGSAFSIRDTGPKEGDEAGYWQLTGERFRDPDTGHTMEIRHNPITGERDYVDLEDS